MLISFEITLYNEDTSVTMVYMLAYDLSAMLTVLGSAPGMAVQDNESDSMLILT